ncbi:hypothetical protein MKX19_11005 [Acinetobacter pittii]|uniref:hypothetical protein n=1 Tax=Acinetobacter TaxID=469 RepID=UPI00035C965C|nr:MULTISPECIES: hypothetical protein [Acinetobacter]MDR0067536.1 hypothetical protein [Acinetobacter sp. 11520]AVZ05322.1 hypothetical protein DBQ26_12145 [Acinetobacter pittii]KQE13728.1 hypothetical protein APD35_11355 [Acinetobacter pittii]MBN6509367.1 hypothetical protein [Acinetobacter pittii]MBT1523637.1 hypothetical protein [Acinetobacter pittii]
MNNPIPNVQIIEDPEYGVILVCQDLELADQFEDFLTEKHSVLFHIKFEPNQVSFFFDKTNTTSKVKELFNKFILSS